MAKFWKTMGIPGGISTILLLIGGLNWGIIGLTGWSGNANRIDLVQKILSYLPFSGPATENIIYGLVGLSAIYSIYALFIKKK